MYKRQFHVPGHKKGVGIDEEFKNFIGENPFKIDVTVFKLVDSLHHPTGPIKKAQILTADAYGADASFFSIHGTSGAIPVSYTHLNLRIKHA